MKIFFFLCFQALKSSLKKVFHLENTFLYLQINFNKIIFSQQFYSWAWTLVPEFNA